MFMTKYFQSHFELQPTIIASWGPDFMPYATNVTLLPPRPNLKHSTVYENIVVGGHRTQYCHGANAPLPPITPAIEAVLHSADILFLAPLAPTYDHAYVRQLMSYVSPTCLKLLSPQGYLRHISAHDLVHPRDFEEAGAILPHFDVVILSDEDHPQAEACAREWKHASPATEIIVTLNSRGAEIIQPNGATNIPTTPVSLDQVIDSTGLGDIFCAAVAYHLYQQDDLAKAVQAAHLATREKLLNL
jgi:sugar/nucleoside kinase (ribokinase family)